MNTLPDAWKWYLQTKSNLKRIQRLANRCWDELPWEGRLGSDPQFRNLDATDVERETSESLNELEDFAVFILFSVFESEVRGHAMASTEAERGSVRHPLLIHWMKQASMAIEEGSFFRTLETFKSPELNNLIEEVNQVRKYRNWVAHGRRNSQPDFVTPQIALERLTRFLSAIRQP